MQAGNLRLPERMDFGRILIERRVLQDLRPVVRLTIWKILRSERGASARQVFFAHELQQLDVGWLHGVANDLHRLGLQCLAIGLRHARHVLEGRIEQALFRSCIRDSHDRGVTPFHRDSRRSEPALQTRAHLFHLLAKIARDIAHLRNPVAIVLEGPEGAPGRVPDVGPERTVGVRRHLEVAKLLTRDQSPDLRQVDVVVQLLCGGQLRPADSLELVLYVLPVP